MLLFVHPALPLVDGRVVYWRCPHNESSLDNSEATRRLWVKIQDASLLEYITVASSKLNPGLATLAAINTFKVNADIIKSGLVRKNGDGREMCGYGCNGGFFELGQFAKELKLVEYDGAGNAVNIKPLQKDYFKKYGLPEADIVKLVMDLSASCVRQLPSACGTAPWRRRRRRLSSKRAHTLSTRHSQSYRSERPRNRKRNHPRPLLLETTRLNELKAPPHNGTPRYAL